MTLVIGEKTIPPLPLLLPSRIVAVAGIGGGGGMVRIYNQRNRNNPARR